MAMPASSLYAPIDISGVAVLITGATAGIGKATAWRFAELGCRLALAGRRAERLEELKQDLLARFPTLHPPIVVSLDVQDTACIAALPATLEKAGMAEVEILVNNAGLALGVAPADEIDVGDIKTMFQTNVVGLMALVSAFGPGMRRRSQGHIVNVSSVAAHDYYAGGSVYCATKSAVNAYTIAARHDLAGTPVRVTAISPGLCETEFSQVRFNGDEEKAKKVYENIVALCPEDVADHIVFATTRPRHVQIADVIAYPTNQGHAKYCLERKGPSLGAARAAPY